MPRADISGDYRSDAGQSRFPRLKLQEGEKARVVVVGAPVVQYVHRMEAPNIVNMAPTYKQIEDRDHNKKTVVETRWVSSPICMGDFAVLRERGVDDKGCLACAAARDRPDIFRSPQPKYAANILKYGLRPGGGWNDIALPYGVSALIWVFGSKVMDKLIDIRSMGEAYNDIRMVDLLLECQEKNFQKPYSNGEFLPVAPAAWLTNDQTRKHTAEYLKFNGATDEDLDAAIGKTVKADWLADDINRVVQRWDVVRAYESRGQGGPQVQQQGFGAETFNQGMGQLQQQYQQQPAQVGQVPPGPQGFAQQQTAAYSPLGMMGGQFQQQPQAAQQQETMQLPPTTPVSEQVLALPQSVPPAAAASPPSSGGLGDLLGGSQAVPPTSVPTAQTAAPAAAPVTQPGVTATTAASPSEGLGGLLGAPGSAPPQGLDGLKDLMASKPADPPPASSSSSGGSFSFADLQRLADGK